MNKTTTSTTTKPTKKDYVEFIFLIVSFYSIQTNIYSPDLRPQNKEENNNGFRIVVKVGKGNIFKLDHFDVKNFFG